MTRTPSILLALRLMAIMEEDPDFYWLFERSAEWYKIHYQRPVETIGE